MASRLAILARAAAIITSAGIALATTPLRAQERAAPDPAEQTFQTILNCLNRGREIVFAPKPDCVPYLKGADVAATKAKMPLGEAGTNWDEICRTKDEPRQLRPDVIKRIAVQKDVAIAPTGIRIIGAVFCSGLDLVGLDLPYSLVIDRSVVNGTIDARNFRTRADFSFDNVIALNSVLLTRARVDGSVYGNRSYVDWLRVEDTQVNGTWWQEESVIFTDAQFHRTTVSGDMRLNGSAFTRLWILSSTVGGTLQLNDTEARCAYRITSSTIGFLTASGAGFGQMQSVGRDGRPAVNFPWWQRALSGADQPYTRQLLESPAVKRIADARFREVSSKPGSAGGALRGCETTSRSAYLEFFLFDNTVRTALCLTSFAWLVPKNPIPDDAHPVSIVALDGTKVGGNLIVDLWPDPPTGLGMLHPGDGPYGLVSSKHKFEAVGVHAGALIYNFADNAKPYFTYVDGLTFDRIHKAQPACKDDLGAQLATQVELPNVDEVLQWLNKNAAQSSQPFAAFVAAFERAGEGATSLRIQRQTYELCEKTAGWFSLVAGLCPRYQLFDAGTDTGPSKAAGAPADVHGPDNRGLFATVWQALSATGELIMIGFNWMMYVLADHGLRPAKVVWSVLGTLVVFFGLFWLGLGIVGFEPKPKEGQDSSSAPVVWPITLLMLFDRLIPVYHIREEHYAIAKVFRRATRAEIKAGSPPSGGPPYPMSYLGRKIMVWPAAEGDIDRVGKWLIALRIIGLIFTVFLLAAINTLAHN